MKPQLPLPGIEEATGKVCIRCGELKPFDHFHRHPRMLDGRLNKCAPCVVKSVGEWREKNPDCRKVEHARNRERKGFKQRDEYLSDIKKGAIGRKASSIKYAHKRRLQTYAPMTEWDEFVLEECLSASRSREAATGFKWHVDHIVPINHKRACGLHVAANLQVTPAVWNVKKGNRNMREFKLSDVAGY